MLSADELLAGGELTYNIEVPAHVLSPNRSKGDKELNTVKMCPLTVMDLQRISRAAKENDNLMATLMVQASLLEPAMSVMQVASLHVGLIDYLLEQVNRISGISTPHQDMEEAAQDPLVKAAFILSKEFGWTPQDIHNLTLGQVMLHLQMLKERQGKGTSKAQGKGEQSAA